MRKAEILLHDKPVGLLEELDHGYRFKLLGGLSQGPGGRFREPRASLEGRAFRGQAAIPFF